MATFLVPAVGTRNTIMTTKTRSPNDQRSIVKNPTNPAYHADKANRVQQGLENPAPPPEPTQAPAGDVKGKH
jgi:hypothetical protein